MIMSYEGYQEALEFDKKKEDELTKLQQQFNIVLLQYLYIYHVLHI